MWWIWRAWGRLVVIGVARMPTTPRVIDPVEQAPESSISAKGVTGNPPFGVHEFQMMRDLTDEPWSPPAHLQRRIGR